MLNATATLSDTLKTFLGWTILGGSFLALFLGPLEALSRSLGI